MTIPQRAGEVWQTHCGDLYIYCSTSVTVEGLNEYCFYSIGADIRCYFTQWGLEHSVLTYRNSVTSLALWWYTQ